MNLVKCLAETGHLQWMEHYLEDAWLLHLEIGITQISCSQVGRDHQVEYHYTVVYDIVIRDLTGVKDWQVLIKLS